MTQRSDRALDALRRIEIVPDFTTNPAGSALIRMGRTMVLCTVSHTPGVPRWREGQGGWLTAEYAMAPGSTDRRSAREATQGKIKGRTHEIQRLIGRSLRTAVDLEALVDTTLTVDCEVLQADAGTRTAAVNGAFVALALACDRLVREGVLPETPVRSAVAAVSVALCGEAILVDPDYEEDVRADVDLNLVALPGDRLIEVQGTAEGVVPRRDRWDAMVDAGLAALDHVRAVQRQVVGDRLPATVWEA